MSMACLKPCRCRRETGCGKSSGSHAMYNKMQRDDRREQKYGLIATLGSPCHLPGGADDDGAVL